MQPLDIGIQLGDFPLCDFPTALRPQLLIIHHSQVDAYVPRAVTDVFEFYQISGVIAEHVPERISYGSLKFQRVCSLEMWSTNSANELSDA